MRACRAPIGPGLCIAFTLSFACFASAPAAASWSANGNPVCTAAGAQTAPSAVTDGSDGMIVVWTDARPGAPGIYAQRVLGDGTIAPGWPADGVLCSGTSTTGPPASVGDGAGGVLIVWLGGADIYAQRIDANGAVHSGWPAGGKVIVPSDFTMPHGFAAVADGAGGAFVTRVRYELPANEQTLRLTRVTPDGDIAIGWPEAGIAPAQASSVTLHALRQDPTGGVLCAYGLYYNAQVDFRYANTRRIAPNGAMGPVGPCTPYNSGGAAPGGIMHAAAAPDGGGGAYTTWRDYDSGTTTSYYYAQHYIGSAGQWTTPYPVTFSEHVIQDGLVGVWLYGRPPGTQRLEAHRRLADGSLPAGWTGTGVVITDPASLNSYHYAPMPTELVVAWSESGGPSGLDIRALSVGLDGVIPAGWNAGGTPVCAANGDQTGPVLLSSGGSVLACWEDRRPNASVSDIYANRISLPSQVGIGPDPTTGIGFLGAWPNPARERIDVTFALAGDGPATLQLIDLAGRSVHRSHLPAVVGRRTVSLGIDGLSSGIYIVRITQGARTSTARVAVAR